MSFICECLASVVGATKHSIGRDLEQEFGELVDTKYSFSNRLVRGISIISKSCPNVSKFDTVIDETSGLLVVKDIVNEK